MINWLSSIPTPVMLGTLGAAFMLSLLAVLGLVAMMDDLSRETTGRQVVIHLSQPGEPETSEPGPDYSLH